MLGKLTLNAIPFDEPIIMGTLVVVMIGGAVILGLITYYRQWAYLWDEWITSRRSQEDRRDVLRAWASSCCCAASRMRS